MEDPATASAKGPAPTLHLSYDSWKADKMEWDSKQRAWVVWRMLPAGRYHYYFTDNSTDGNTDNSKGAIYENSSDVERAQSLLGVKAVTESAGAAATSAAAAGDAAAGTVVGGNDVNADFCIWRKDRKL